MRPGEGLRTASAVRMTARESEVLGWVAAGKSDWAIGRILHISGKTVNFHVENAKRKLGVGTRLQAVVVALRAGLIADLMLDVLIGAPDGVLFTQPLAILG